MHECNVKNCDRPDLSPETIAKINTALARVASGEFVDRGSFEQYYHDDFTTRSVCSNSLMEA